MALYTATSRVKNQTHVGQNMSVSSHKNLKIKKKNYFFSFKFCQRGLKLGAIAIKHFTAVIDAVSQ
jgi:hypothetical protein